MRARPSAASAIIVSAPARRSGLKRCRTVDAGRGHSSTSRHYDGWRRPGGARTLVEIRSLGHRTEGLSTSSECSEPCEAENSAASPFPPDRRRAQPLPRAARGGQGAFPCALERRLRRKRRADDGRPGRNGTIPIPSPCYLFALVADALAPVPALHHPHRRKVRSASGRVSATSAARPCQARSSACTGDEVTTAANTTCPLQPRRAPGFRFGAWRTGLPIYAAALGWRIPAPTPSRARHRRRAVSARIFPLVGQPVHARLFHSGSRKASPFPRSGFFFRPTGPGGVMRIAAVRALRTCNSPRRRPAAHPWRPEVAAGPSSTRPRSIPRLPKSC